MSRRRTGYMIVAAIGWLVGGLLLSANIEPVLTLVVCAAVGATLGLLLMAASS